MIVKLLTEYHLELLSLKGGCRGSSESTFVKMSNCWKFHAAAHIWSESSSVSIVFISCTCSSKYPNKYYMKNSKQVQLPALLM